MTRSIGARFDHFLLHELALFSEHQRGTLFRTTESLSVRGRAIVKIEVRETSILRQSQKFDDSDDLFPRSSSKHVKAAATRLPPEMSDSNAHRRAPSHVREIVTSSRSGF
jgi:hypothetical protein